METESLIENLIQHNQINVVHSVGQYQQIEFIHLYDQIYIVRKNFQNISDQFKNEEETITALKNNLGDKFSLYFVNVFYIDSPRKHIYMEKLSQDLLDFIGIDKGLSEEQSKNFFRNIFNCVFQLHSNKIVHGDIKPENILLKIAEDGCIRFCDLGHSMEITTDLINLRHGTKRYVQSSLYQKWESKSYPFYDPYKFDIFALGVTLFESLVYQVFDQTFLDKLLTPETHQQFWKLIQKKYPSTQNWSSDLRHLFVGMIHPNESERWNISDLINSQWLQEDNVIIYQMEIEEQQKQIVQQCLHHLDMDSEGRGDQLETKLAVQNAEEALKVLISNEEYEGFLNLETKREAQKISIQAFQKSTFMSELSPQELLIILLSEASQYASNWKKEGFLDPSQYILNVVYDYQDREVELEEINDTDISEEEEINIINVNKSLSFGIKIWELEDSQNGMKSLIEFINPDKNTGDYLKYHRHIHDICKLIKKY